MALRKIHNTYYVYFVDIDGTQRTRSLKTTDRATAEMYHRKFMIELQSRKSELMIMNHFPERFPQVTPQPVQSIAPEPKHDLGEHQRGSIAIAKMWDLALTRRKLSGTHATHWRKFVKAIGVKFADQVTPALALRYLEDHYSSGNGKSFNNVKSALNTVFRCCLVEAGLAQSPFTPIVNKRVTDVEHHRNLSLAEVDQIMAAPDLPLYLKIMTMLSRWTAQRLETCARMTPDMFDFESKVFIIDPGKNERFDEWVCCPILPDLESFIKPLIQQCKDPQLPIVQHFGYTTNNAFSKLFVQEIRKLGIFDSAAEKASFHSLRGTAITWFKEQGITGDDLSSITGHDSRDVESIYARPIKNISQIAKSFYGKNM